MYFFCWFKQSAHSHSPLDSIVSRMVMRRSMQLTAMPSTPPSFTTAEPPRPTFTWSRLPSLGSSRVSTQEFDAATLVDAKKEAKEAEVDKVKEEVKEADDAEIDKTEEMAQEIPSQKEAILPQSDEDEEDRYALDYPEYDPEEEYDYHYDPYDEFEEMYFRDRSIW